MEDVKLLSGRQLVQNGTPKGDSFLPEKLHKESVPTKSWVERKSIQYSLENQKKILEDQRVQKRGMFTQARWLKEQDESLVVEKKGNHWLHMGHTREQQTYLLPEETLFLMEMNSLELKYGGVPVSIQQAYSLLLGKSVSFDQYRVYASLSKQGYKLLRHNTQNKYIFEGNNRLENYKLPTSKQTSTSNIDASDTIQEKDVGERKQHDEDCVIIAENQTSLDTAGISNDITNTTASSQEVEHINDITEKEVESVSAVLEPEVIDLDAIAFQKVKQKIYSNIVDCLRRNIICVPAPDSKYIPKNIKLSKEMSIVKLTELKRNCKSNVNNCGTVVSRDPRLNKSQRNGVNTSGINSCNKTSESSPRFNNFSNNSLFYNHIFQQTQFKNVSLYGVMDYRQFTGGSFLGNMQYVRSINCIQQTQIIRPSRQAVAQNNGRQEVINPFSNVEMLKRGTQNRAIRRKRSNSRDPRFKPKKAKKFTEITGKEAAIDKIRTMIDKYNSIGESSHTQIIKNNLSNIVAKVNAVFNQNYSLQFIGNKVTMVDDKKKSENIVQLSSDSDSSDDSTKNNKKNCQNIQNRRQSIYDSLTDSSEDDLNEIFNLPSVSKEIKDVFGKWISDSNSWNTVIYNQKLKNVSHNAVGYNMMRFVFQKSDVKLSSWKQLKAICEKNIILDTIAISDDENLEDNYDEVPMDISQSFDDITIKVDRTEPLIRPEDCKTIKSVLERLSIIKSPNELVSYMPDGVESTDEAGDIRLKVYYDLYMPDHKNLRKSDPPPPAYSIIILDCCSPLPSPTELSTISNSLPAHTPFLLAIVSHDCISFLQMENVRIPDIISTTNSYIQEFAEI